MTALADAGIYVVLDTDTSKYSLNRLEPKKSYNSVYLQSVFATITKFHNYTNVLAFLSGNEVVNDVNTTDCAPYVKAVVRDMKSYISGMGYRSIPVGYSAADVSQNQEILANYLNCGTDDERGVILPPSPPLAGISLLPTILATAFLSCKIPSFKN